MASAAGVSKGTLYLYYPSKEELLKAVIAHYLSARIAAGAAQAAGHNGSTTALLQGILIDWWTQLYDSPAAGVFKLVITEVRNFPVGNALYWLERYGIDGLRVDAVASMLYRDDSREPGHWLPNVHGGRENLEAIDFFRRLNEVVGVHRPQAVTLAEESTAFPAVSRPTYA